MRSIEKQSQNTTSYRVGIVPVGAVMTLPIVKAYGQDKGVTSL